MLLPQTSVSRGRRRVNSCSLLSRDQHRRRCGAARGETRETAIQPISVNTAFWRQVCGVADAQNQDAECLEEGMLSAEIRRDELELLNIGTRLVELGAREGLRPYVAMGPDRGHQRKIFATLGARLDFQRALKFGVVGATHARKWRSLRGLHGRNASLSSQKLKDLLLISGVSLDEQPAELRPRLSFITRLVFVAPRLAPYLADATNRPMKGNEDEQILCRDAMLLYELLDPERMRLWVEIAEQHDGDMQLGLSDWQFGEMLFCLADRHNLMLKLDQLDEMFGLIDADDIHFVLSRLCSVAHQAELFFWATELFRDFGPDVDRMLFVCPNDVGDRHDVATHQLSDLSGCPAPGCG